MILAKVWRLAESNCGEIPYRWEGKDLLLRVSEQPRSSCNAIIEIRNAHIRIKLTSVPVDGEENQVLKKLLSKSFRVPVHQISIEKGETSKIKRIRISAPKNLPELVNK